MVQWVRILLPVQRAWVQSLVQEDSTCHGATKPMIWCLRLATAEPTCQLLKPAHSRTHKPQLMSPCAVTTEVCALQLESSLHCLHLEKAHVQQQRPRVILSAVSVATAFSYKADCDFLLKSKVSRIRVHTLPTVRGQRAGLASNELFGPGSS